MWGGGRGIEFRPFRRNDYGYETDQQVITSWGNWLLQTYGNFALGDSRKAAGVLFGAMLFNDFLLDEFLTVGSGSSFVHNIQMGYNLFHYITQKTPSWTTAVCSGVGVFSVVIMSPLKEAYEGKPFNEGVAHDAHALGVALGLLSGLLLNANF